MAMRTVISLLLLCSTASAQSLSDAARLFKGKCAACHGTDGKGATTEGAKMAIRPLPGDISDQKIREVIEGGVNRTTADGKKQSMTAYKDKLTADQIAGLVAYVRSFGPAPAKAEPKPAAKPPAKADASAAPPKEPAAAVDNEAGRKLWGARCASCHGADGKGKKAGVADMTTSDWQKGHSDEVLAAALAHLAKRVSPKDVPSLISWMRSLGPR
jgi:mono/diheme cytochrome c family protein